MCLFSRATRVEVTRSDLVREFHSLDSVPSLGLDFILLCFAMRAILRVRSLRTRQIHHIRGFRTSPAWFGRRVIQPFKLADIGEGITECEVIKWCVNHAT